MCLNNFIVDSMYFCLLFCFVILFVILLYREFCNSGVQAKVEKKELDQGANDVAMTTDGK